MLLLHGNIYVLICLLKLLFTELYKLQHHSGSFSGNCNEYYMADYKRFGCGAIGNYFDLFNLILSS